MKPVKIRVPVRVHVDVKTTTTGGTSKRPKLEGKKAETFAKKEAYRKLRSRQFGERF